MRTLDRSALRQHFIRYEIEKFDFSRALTYPSVCSENKQILNQPGSGCNAISAAIRITEQLGEQA